MFYHVLPCCTSLYTYILANFSIVRALESREVEEKGARVFTKY